MHKILASLLAVVVTVLSIAVMAALVDDSKLTAQQVGQYRAEHFVAVDDVFDLGLQHTGIVYCSFTSRLVPYSRSKLKSNIPPRNKTLLSEQLSIVSLLKLNDDMKSFLIF